MAGPAIDPVRCWIRHVRRTRAGETGTTIANAVFTREPMAALNGRQGWQNAKAAAVLSDTGELTVTFPNAYGDDGVLHRKRFAYFTDDDYIAGEEWLEVYREGDQVLSICTPYRGRVSKSTVELVGFDVAGLLSRFRGSELDVFDGHAPRDVFEHYTRIPVLAYATNFAGFTGVPWNGWVNFGGGGTITVGPTGGPRLTNGVAIAHPGPTGGGDCWIAEARLRNVTGAGAELEFDVGGVTVSIKADGSVDVVQNFGGGSPAVASGPPELDIVGKLVGLSFLGDITIRVIARYDRVFVLVNGELAAQYRRVVTPALQSTELLVESVAGSTIDILAIHVVTLPPFAMRGTDKGTRRLPGIPPPGGLRARYYNAAPTQVALATNAGRLARLGVLAEEPTLERLEPTLAKTAGTPIPELPGAMYCRWVGAIYLDLAASDRRVRFAQSPVDPVRIFIGKTTRLSSVEACNQWTGTPGAGGAFSPAQSPNLRTLLGTSESGWYPIVVELYKTTNTVANTWSLEDVTVDAGGTATAAWTVVPLTRLSPVGVLEEHWRNESHRAVIDTITETFGYQWRVDPATLESGKFPGEVIPRLLVGRMTDKVITDFEGVDVVVDSDASDTVTMLVADAAGIADPNGSGQLSAEVIDYRRALLHMGIHGDYESLADMSEANAVETRLGSLLALRSSPNEQVAVRPTDGSQGLVDTFPLTGALERLRWRVGDGMRLLLASIGVKDNSPRQLRRVELDLRPNAIAPPTVGFRQRPRSAAAVLKRTLRAVYAQSRNYQGTATLLAGAPGSSVGNGGVPASGNGTSVDIYSRLPMPVNLAQIDRVWLAVHVSTGAGSIAVLAVNTGIIVGLPGLYDITAFVKRDAAAIRMGVLYAGVINASGDHEYSLVCRLRI